MFGREARNDVAEVANKVILWQSLKEQKNSVEKYGINNLSVKRAIVGNTNQNWY